MISPITTIIRNKTNQTIILSVLREHPIVLRPMGTDRDTYACPGDLFSQIGNSRQAEEVLLNVFRGQIELTYETEPFFHGVCTQQQLLQVSGSLQRMYTEYIAHRDDSLLVEGFVAEPVTLETPVDPEPSEEKKVETPVVTPPETKQEEEPIHEEKLKVQEKSTETAKPEDTAEDAKSVEALAPETTAKVEVVLESPVIPTTPTVAKAHVEKSKSRKIKVG